MAELNYQVGASADDAGGYWTGSAWYIYPTEAYIGAGYYSAAGLKWFGGYRFTGVTIPVGAIITTAYLTFRASHNISATTVRSKIRGEQNNAAAAFSDITNYRGRTKTTAVVTWDSIPAWTANSDYNSAEIKTIIQELVNDYTGLSSANIVLFWDDEDDLSDHTSDCRRLALPYDASTTYAPKLHIEYTLLDAPGIINFI